MAKKETNHRPEGRNIPLAVGVAGGAGVGFVIARTIAGPGSAALSKVIEIVATQTALQTAGPIIAASIVGSSVILSAVAIPLAVTWAIRKGSYYDNQEDKEEDNQSTD